MMTKMHFYFGNQSYGEFGKLINFECGGERWWFLYFLEMFYGVWRLKTFLKIILTAN